MKTITGIENFGSATHLGAVNTQIPSDEKAVQRINDITNRTPLSFDSTTAPSLIGRATIGAPVKLENEESKIQEITNQLQDIEPEHFAAVEKAITENPQPEANYMIRVRNTIAQILDQLSRIAEKDRTQVEEMKIKYKKANQDSADLTRKLGSHGLKFSAIALAASLIQLSPHETDKAIGNIFAQQFCPKLGDMFGSSLQASKQQADSLAQLVIQEYSAKTSKGSSEANSKQEITRILDEVLQSLKRAAQAN